MKTNKQSGFSTAAAIVAVVAVVVVMGLIAWRVMDANKAPATQSPNTTTNQAQIQTDPNEGYVVIKEWGVRFPISEGIADAVYKVHTTENGTSYANLSTASIVSKLGEDCGVNSSYSALGQVTRLSNNQEVTPGYAVKKQVGDYTYLYYTPQTGCSTDASMDETLNQNLALMRSAMDKLEAAK